MIEEYVRSDIDLVDNLVVKVSMRKKLEKAKEYLGKKWVLHPEYQFNPKHSQSESIRLGYINPSSLSKPK